MGEKKGITTDEDARHTLAVEEEVKRRMESDVLPQSWIQVISFISLWGMLIIDRVLHLAVPPFPEHWYGAVFGVAVSGKLVEIFKTMKK